MLFFLTFTHKNVVMYWYFLIKVYLCSWIIIAFL